MHLSLTLESNSDPQAINNSKLSLIGRIVSNKPTTLRLAKSAINKGWGLRHEAEVHQLGKNLFRITFATAEDKNRAWNFRPWVIYGSHILLQPWKDKLTLQEMDLDHSSFWVQMHGLPSGYISRNNADKISQHLGIVEEVDLGDVRKLEAINCMRIRIKWNVNKALLPGFSLKREGLPELWISFKYEKLGDFCFNCGKLGHDLSECKDSIQFDQEAFECQDPTTLGPWMSAPPGRKNLSLSLQNSGDNKIFSGPESSSTPQKVNPTCSISTSNKVVAQPDFTAAGQEDTHVDLGNSPSPVMFDNSILDTIQGTSSANPIEQSDSRPSNQNQSQTHQKTNQSSHQKANISTNEGAPPESRKALPTPNQHITVPLTNKNSNTSIRTHQRDELTEDGNKLKRKLEGVPADPADRKRKSNMEIEAFGSLKSLPTSKQLPVRKVIAKRSQTKQQASTEKEGISLKMC